MDQQPIVGISVGEIPKAKKPKWKAPTVEAFQTNQDGVPKNEVIAYLKRFGYMQQQTLDEANDLSTALLAFQEFAHLNTTGVFDEETSAIMSKPRCGVADKQTGTQDMSAQFVAQGSKWNKTALTYRFENFTPDITPAQVRAVMQGAFGRWAAITTLSFSEVTSGEDITISFVRGDHGDGDPFDGPGNGSWNVYAHANFPDWSLTGDIHFDEYETWSEYFLGYVALHEIGHSLGLAHSPVYDAVMYYDLSAARTELHADDMAGIHSLYGWRNPRWQQLDNNAATTTILASGNDLYQLHSNGLVWKYIGPAFTGWELIDNKPNTVQIVAGLGGQLYQRRRDGAIARYNGTPMDWSLIDLNPDCVDIAAGDYELYQRHTEGSIYRYAGPNTTPHWELIDDNPRTVQITAAQGLYQRHNNGDLWRYIGPNIKWDLLQNHSAAGPIVAATDKLYQLNGHDIWQWSWSGAQTNGQLLDRNPATVGIYARGKYLYQIHDSGRIWRYTGTPISGWELMDAFSATKEIVGSENGDVFQRHSTGAIWRLIS